MDRGLDEIISARQANEGRSNRGRNRRRDAPRDSNRKGGRDVANLDDEWIHDKYEEDENDSYHASHRRNAAPGRYRDRNEPDPFGRDRIRTEGTKIEIMNLHWDISESDLERLVEGLGPTLAVKIHYDDTNRSTGKAEVTFKYADDAQQAVADFDGANAKGQPIRVRILPAGAGRGRNPLDRAVPPTRSLLDRVEGGGSDASRSRNRDRDRSRSPGAKRAELRANAREDIDRYVPDDQDGSRPRRRSPRRERSDRGDGRGRGGRGAGGDRRGERRERVDERGHKLVGGRPRMTQEELDRDMDEYFNKQNDGANEPAASANTVGAQAPATTGGMDEDIDMAE